MDTATIENLNHECSPQDLSKTRRMKVILPQCYAALAIFAVNFSYIIFAATMTEAIYYMDPNFPAYVWYSTMTWIGFLFGGIVAQIVGARMVVILAGATSVIGWITFMWLSPISIIRWMSYIIGLVQGMMQAPCFVYLAEISQPNMRSALMATLCASDHMRLIYFYLVGVKAMKTNAFVNIVIALFGVVIMFFLPDSPYWLANKGRYHEVEPSLAWFRGRTTVENVKSESKEIISNAQNGPTARKLFCQKSFYKVTLIAGYVFLASLFVRIFYVTYPLIMSERLIDLTISNFSTVFCVSTVFASIAFVFLVAILGQRMMFLISLFGGTIAILIASIVGYLRESQNLSIDTHSRFILICSMVAYVSLITGVESVPLLLNGELFPSKLRYFGVGFILFLMNISSYKFIIHNAGLLTLAIASIIGFISLLWLFPRNDNKSLVEIEQSSASISELRSKK